MAAKLKVRISSPSEEGLVKAINANFYAQYEPTWALLGDAFPKKVVHKGIIDPDFIARYKNGRYQFCQVEAENV